MSRCDLTYLLALRVFMRHQQSVESSSWLKRFEVPNHSQGPPLRLPMPLSKAERRRSSEMDMEAWMVVERLVTCRARWFCDILCVSTCPGKGLKALQVKRHKRNGLSKRSKCKSWALSFTCFIVPFNSPGALRELARTPTLTGSTA